MIYRKHLTLSSLWHSRWHIVYTGFNFYISLRIVNQSPRHHFCIIPKERKSWVRSERERELEQVTEEGQGQKPDDRRVCGSPQLH